MVKTAGVPGGGTTVSFLQKPQSQNKKAEPRKLTLSVDGDAIAAETAALEDGSMVPAADSDLGAKQSEGTTTLTVEATDQAQTLIFLPEDAPKAADPDDQDDVDGWWSKLVGWITGDDDSEDAATPEDTAAGSGTSTSTPTSTSSPSPTSTDDNRGQEEDDPRPSSTSTPSPASTSTPSRTSTGGDVCVVTQRQDQQSIAEEGGGQQSEDYAVSDGPTAAPTFSEETRKKAAAASDCGEGDGTKTVAEPQPGDLVTDDSPTAAEGVTRADVADGDWLSGAAGDPDGIGDLRGAPAEIATTWANGGSTGIDVPQLQDGGEYGADTWSKSLIVSVSPFEDGGSWAKAAAGDYDANWTRQLTNIKNGWGERNGSLFISLAWELNGNWYPWAVTAEQTQDFRDAWTRYRALQRKIVPDALLTLTMNKESNGYDGDSSDLIVEGTLDAYGVDYYNHYPYAATEEAFTPALDERDGGGGPKGLEAHRETAQAAGVPLVLPEWNGSAKNGDAPGFITGMHSFFSQHAGSGAGQVLAESLFEIDKDDNNWALLGGTKMPQSAKAYAREFSDVGDQS
ncbi:hypothetical protein [Kineococcus rubinsiae]|uniref:hypothetical protein n=1 Tax=Kineococcus rubinsiae TaxID=2609562 RepID=UPI0014305D1A|nr:hypothetical protein [Kineococcus rubinsiae]NIZ91732.1 hypothetical protein [Kineococcus rubinsiae]